MTEENAQIVYEAFRRVEADDFEGFGKLWHPEAHNTAAEGWPEQGPFVGRENIVRQFERLFEDWSENEFQDVEVAAEHDDWIVVTYVWQTRGASSGLEARFDLATAFRIEDGQVLEGHFRWNVDEALEAIAERTA